MSGILNDLRKIYRLLMHDELVFHYETVQANKLYLLYCLLGNFYFEPAFHWHTKVYMAFWAGSCVFGALGSWIAVLFFGYTQVVEYLRAIFAVTFVFVSFFAIPLCIIFIHKTEVMDAVQLLDEIFKKRSDPKYEEVRRKACFFKKGAFYFAILFLGLGVYGLSAPLSVLFFYEEEKIKNSDYYPYTIPLMDTYATPILYLMITCFVELQGFHGAITSYSYMIFFAVFGQYCCYEVKCILYDLKMPDVDGIESYEKNVRTEMKPAIKRTVIAHQRFMEMLNTIRDFIEIQAGIMLTVQFFLVLAHAFAVVSADSSMTVRIRETSIAFVQAGQMFVFSWLGNIIDEMIICILGSSTASTVNTDAVKLPRIEIEKLKNTRAFFRSFVTRLDIWLESLSFGVYDIPWCWSTEHRKDVYIALCQTQTSGELNAFKVYPLQLNSFARFFNTIQSTINLLRFYEMRKMKN